MRPFLLLLFAPLWLGLLTACDPGAKSGPRLDFVGTSRFTSSDRLLTTPGDTVTSYIYADNRDASGKAGNPLLTHFRIFVTYDPGLSPVDYNQTPVIRDTAQRFTYLDSAINTREFVFLHRFAARTTSGRSTWRFETEDAAGDKASRSYRLTMRNTDSVLVYHRYNVLLQAPRTAANRSFLDLKDGLVLSGSATRNNPDAQQLINLVYVPGTNGSFGFAAPADPTAIGTANLHLTTWAATTRSLLALRRTTFDANAFTNADTEAELLDAFNGGQTSTTYTGPLAKGNVVAFNTPDNRKGLIYVQDVLATTIPTVVLQVRVTKRTVR